VPHFRPRVGWNGLARPNSGLCNAQDGCNWMNLGVKSDAKVNSAALAFIYCFLKGIFYYFKLFEQDIPNICFGYFLLSD
jgi:hypothetical protein